LDFRLVVVAGGWVVQTSALARLYSLSEKVIVFLVWLGLVCVAGDAPWPSSSCRLFALTCTAETLGACRFRLFWERPGPMILIRIHDAQVNLGVGGDRKTMASAAANKPIHVSGDKKVIRIKSTTDCLGFRV
jgi:hypothetical protein